MQTDRDALLAGILADPDADLPRLVFADWLEETGHPANCARAEYIRLAIELAEAQRRGMQGEQVRQFRSRLGVLEEMFDDGCVSFAKTLPNRCSVPYDRSRGFIKSIGISSEGRSEWASTDLVGTQFRELFRTHPIVEVELHGAPRSSDGLLGIRLPVSTRRLQLYNFRHAGPVLVHILAASISPRLRTVTAAGCDLTDADVVRLVQTLRGNASLSGVESLNLGSNPLTDHAAHTLAAAELAPTFRFLGVEGTRITNAGREVLFRRFGFEELRPRLALS